jgi:hypothetical protein
MDRLVYFKRIASDPAALETVDRRIIVRKIVDELQEFCDSDASGGADPIPGARWSASDDPSFDNIDRQSRRPLLAEDRRRALAASRDDG